MNSGDILTTHIEQKKTGTTIVGIVAKDAILIGGDRRMSFGGRAVGKKDVEKVFPVMDNLVLAMAGNVSDIQMNVKVIKAQLKLLHLRRGKVATVKEAVNLLATMLFGNLRRSYFMPAISEFIAGGYDSEGGPQLYDISPDGVLLQYKDYVTSGSGMLYATGVFEANYKPNLSIPDATKLVVQAVHAAIERDTASGNGIDVYAITKNGFQKVYEKELTLNVQ